MNFVGLDIETTGLERRKGHRLIQIGVAFHRLHVLRYDIRPWGHIVYDPEAMKINGFTEERIDQANGRAHVDQLISAQLGVMGFNEDQLTPVGWNVGSFDLPFIRDELPRTAKFFSHRVVDLTSIAMFLTGGTDNWREYKNLAHREIEIELGYAKWHDAGYDALAALLQWDRWSQRYQKIG